MAKYIVYCFNETGHIARSEWIDAENDEDALRTAEAMKLPHGCEVWDRDRRVGRIEDSTD